MPELRCRHDVLFFDQVSGGGLAAKGEAGRTGLAFFGGDQDDPVGGPGAIDSGRGGVFQYGEGSDIVGVDQTKGVAGSGDAITAKRQSVDHDEQVVARAQ